MSESISQLIQSPWQLAIISLAAFFIGMSKTGIQGITTITIPLMAVAFGAKESTGVILPMLCFADLIAVLYYRQWAQWKYIIKLLPFAVLGFFVAIGVDTLIPVTAFRYLMAGSILVGLVFIFKRKNVDYSEYFWFAPLFGLLGGFTTMIGNAAGPVMAVYLLSMRLPKMVFVGTSAWFFLLVNYMKLPLQAFVWKNISVQTLALDAVMIPLIILGAIAGIYLVKRLPEKNYRTMIVVLTLLSTLMLLY